MPPLNRHGWRVVDGSRYVWRPADDGVEVLGSEPGCRVLTIELPVPLSARPDAELVARLLRSARATVGWDPADPEEDLDLRLLG